MIKERHPSKELLHVLYFPVTPTSQYGLWADGSYSVRGPFCPPSQTGHQMAHSTWLGTETLVDIQHVLLPAATVFHQMKELIVISGLCKSAGVEKRVQLLYDMHKIRIDTVRNFCLSVRNKR